MLLEQVRNVKDQTGHIQIPLDLTRITKERLEKKIKQRQRRPNNLALTEGQFSAFDYFRFLLIRPCHNRATKSGPLKS